MRTCVLLIKLHEKASKKQVSKKLSKKQKKFY